MNIRKVFLTLIIILSLIGSGTILSKIQSKEADQLLETYGLSNNTRYFDINSNRQIKDFLTYLDNRYEKATIQIHFDNKYEADQVLVWANNNIVTQPTENGRYFSIDDFAGQVPVVVLGPDSTANITEIQGNRYLKLDDRYYTVIGEFKNYHQIEQDSYYLTTGINQPTATGKLKDYRIIIDAPEHIIRQVAKHYHTQMYVPKFVTTHRNNRFSTIKEIVLIALMVLIGIVANILVATIYWRQGKSTHLRDDLLRNWILNRSIRYILFEVLLAVGVYILLSWRAFYSYPGHFAILSLFEFILFMVSYVLTYLYLSLKGIKLV